MIGSIIGDVVGSVYEFSNIKTKDFLFFEKEMEYTDDSILTLATADWLMQGGDSARYYAAYAQANRSPMGGYGSSFLCWVHKTIQGEYAPYNSCGNGYVNPIVM